MVCQNEIFFPVRALKKATNDIFDEDGQTILQYVGTEGDLPLRELIVADYKNTLRLNFSSVDPDIIKEGIKRLGLVLHDMLT